METEGTMGTESQGFRAVLLKAIEGEGCSLIRLHPAEWRPSTSEVWRELSCPCSNDLAILVEISIFFTPP